VNPIRLRTAAPIVAWSLVALGVSVPVSGAEYPPPPEREIPAPLAGLSDDFESILHTYRWPRAHWSVLVVSMDRGDTLFAEAPDAPMAPASNLKLLTTAAALRTLGPSFRFRTYLLADGEVREGVLHGDLVLYGTGDPSISDRLFPDRTEVFRRLAEQLEALGIHTITGDLVGDASFLSGPRHPEGWDRKDLNDAFAAPVSALSFNENVLSFRVVPSRTAGEAPTVHTIPARGGMVVVNNARTVTSRTGPRLAILRDHPDDAVRIEGRIRKGSRDVWRQMTVSDPALFATLALRGVLEDRGISVIGGSRSVERRTASVIPAQRRVVAPAMGRKQGSRTRVLARHESPPLEKLLEVVNKRSNNLYAELIFRTVGRVRDGVGSEAGAAVAVSDALVDLGMDPGDVVQKDGSGLSAESRVSAGFLVDLLRRMEESPSWPYYWASLPEAGQRRGLRRMYQTPAANNLRAKTGTIQHVSALSGIVHSSDGERLAFSFLVNSTPSPGRAKEVENELGARLASFSRRSGSPLPPGYVAVAQSDDALGSELTHRGDWVSASHHP